MLVVNVKDRININDVLNHPWFKEIDLKQNIPIYES